MLGVNSYEWVRAVYKSRYIATLIRSKEGKGDVGKWWHLAINGKVAPIHDSLAIFRHVGTEYFSTQAGAELWAKVMGEDVKFL